MKSPEAEARRDVARHGVNRINGGASRGATQRLQAAGGRNSGAVIAALMAGVGRHGQSRSARGIVNTKAPLGAIAAPQTLAHPQQ